MAGGENHLCRSAGDAEWSLQPWCDSLRTRSLRDAEDHGRDVRGQIPFSQAEFAGGRCDGVEPLGRIEQPALRAQGKRVVCQLAQRHGARHGDDAADVAADFVQKVGRRQFVAGPGDDVARVLVVFAILACVNGDPLDEGPSERRPGADLD